MVVVSSFAALPHRAKLLLLAEAPRSVFCGRARARPSSWQPKMPVLWCARTHCGCTCTRAAVLTRRCCLHALLLDLAPARTMARGAPVVEPRLLLVVSRRHYSARRRRRRPAIIHALSVEPPRSHAQQKYTLFSEIRTLTRGRGDDLSTRRRPRWRSRRARPSSGRSCPASTSARPPPTARASAARSRRATAATSSTSAPTRDRACRRGRPAAPHRRRLNI